MADRECGLAPFVLVAWEHLQVFDQSRDFVGDPLTAGRDFLPERLGFFRGRESLEVNEPGPGPYIFRIAAQRPRAGVKFS